jgi:regulator of RNase E activity RraA
VEQRTGIEAGSWGGLLSLGAKARGIAGVIVEGPARDIDQSIEIEFPVFARSLTALTARGRISEQATNVPVKIGDIVVLPGDYVIADRSAVIIISKAEIGLVLPAAERIAAKEEEMAKLIRAGQPIGTAMGGNYEQLLDR